MTFFATQLNPFRLRYEIDKVTGALRVIVGVQLTQHQSSTIPSSLDADCVPHHHYPSGEGQRAFGTEKHHFVGMGHDW